MVISVNSLFLFFLNLYNKEIEIKDIGIDIAKKSKKFEEIKKLIYQLFDVKKEIEEDKDIIFLT